MKNEKNCEDCITPECSYNGYKDPQAENCPEYDNGKETNDQISKLQEQIESMKCCGNCDCLDDCGIFQYANKPDNLCGQWEPKDKETR